MKTKIITTLLLGCMLSAYADVQNIVVSAPPALATPPVAGNSVTKMTANGLPGPSMVQMSLINSSSGTPQVQIDLGAPATLTVYDQNHIVAFTSQLNPGRTIVDTTNFPLGNDQLVVTSSQVGAVFTMTQNVYVGSPASNS